MIKVLIADDHQLVIDGLRFMLAEEADLQCVGQARNGHQVLEQLAQQPAEVLLLDINMPGMNGLECCRAVRSQFPQVRILMLSMLRDSVLIRELLEAGASGYLLKNAGKEDVVTAIRKVHRGERAFSPDLLEVLLDHSPQAASESERLFPKISRREKQVLQLILQERTTSEIADELFISFGTVETHRRNLLTKLNVRNTAGLVRKAVEYKLCDD